MKQARTVLVGKHERQKTLVVRLEYNINMSLKGLGWLKGWSDCIWLEIRRSAPQGSPRTPAKCIAATTPGLIVRILKFWF